MTNDRWTDIERLARFFLDINQKNSRVAQILKLVEEIGEVAEAYIGANGLNPRKKGTYTDQDIAEEIADVAGTALIALFFFCDNPADVMNGAIDKFVRRLDEHEAGVNEIR